MSDIEVKNPNKYRLLRVFEYMQHTDINHPLNVTQILEKLKAEGVLDKEPDRKSILRDLQTIEACGYTLEFRTNHSEGRYMVGKNEVFAGYQLKMLADAVASARFLAADDAKKLVDAIMSLASESDKELLAMVVVRDESLNVATKQAKNNFYEILEAIREHKQLKFKYNPRYLSRPEDKDLANAGRVYHVSPYYLVTAKNDYYMICCTGEHSNFSHYRVSRMMDVLMEEDIDAKPLKDSSTYQELVAAGKNISDYLREHINMWFGDTQRVNLHCKQYCRLDVMGTFGNRVNIYDCEDDSAYFTTSVNVQAAGGFFSWVAGFGGDVIITGPKSVCAAYKEYLLKQLEAYE